MSHKRKRHPKSPSISTGDRQLLLAMESHLDECYGPGERLVMHELFSPLVHVDIHVVPPSDEFPHVRLVTCGMAERRMRVDDKFRWSPYAELTLALPPDWPVSHRAMRDVRNRWPFEMLRDLARNTHAYGTYLWEGHCVSWGAVGQPFAPDTELCGALVLPPENVPENFDEFTCGNRTVNILGLYPLHEREMEMLASEGVNQVVERLDAAGVTDVVDPQRASIAA